MATPEKASRMRKKIAVNMANSWHTSPKCDYLMKINAEPMMAFRKKYNEDNGTKVSFLNLVIKAAGIALSEFPYVNSAYDFENHTHLMNDDINVGFAIAVGSGLIVTNVKHTDRIGLDELSRETTRLVDAAQKSTLLPDDVAEGCITINNMGSYSRLVSHTAIINQPELAILSMYNITDEVVVKDGAVIAQKQMNLMLGADHRVIDGKMACDFLTRIVELLENPENLI